MATSSMHTWAHGLAVTSFLVALVSSVLYMVFVANIEFVNSHEGSPDNWTPLFRESDTLEPDDKKYLVFTAGLRALSYLSLWSVALFYLASIMQLADSRIFGYEISFGGGAVSYAVGLAGGFIVLLGLVFWTPIAWSAFVASVDIIQCAATSPIAPFWCVAPGTVDANNGRGMNWTMVVFLVIAVVAQLIQFLVAVLLTISRVFKPEMYRSVATQYASVRSRQARSAQAVGSISL